MQYKKGVSPLIATVLLLAFAVALATVVINIYPSGKCNLADVGIATINGKQRICYDESSKDIKVFMENKGKNDILGFKIRVSGETDTLNIEHISLKLQQNEEKKMTFEYDVDTYGQILDLEIFPMVNVSGRPIECELKKPVSSVPIC